MGFGGGGVGVFGGEVLFRILVVMICFMVYYYFLNGLICFFVFNFGFEMFCSRINYNKLCIKDVSGIL